MNTMKYIGSENLKFGKALQIYIGDNPHLVLGDKDYKHTEMLESVLEEEGLDFKREIFGPLVGPRSEGDGYKLAGAGWFNRSENAILLHLGSDAYKIGICRKHAEVINELIPEYNIEVGERPSSIDIDITPRTKPIDDIPF